LLVCVDDLSAEGQSFYKALPDLSEDCIDDAINIGQMRVSCYGANNPYTILSLLKAVDGEMDDGPEPIQTEALKARIAELEELLAKKP